MALFKRFRSTENPLDVVTLCAGDVMQAVRGPVAQASSPERLANAKELLQYAADVYRVIIPSKRCCANHVSPADVLCACYFADYPMVVLKASRAFGGKTYLISLLTLLEATTLSVSAGILAGSGGQAKRAITYMSKLIRLPGAPSDQLLDEPSATRLRFTAGHDIEAMMASQTSVRGLHCVRLRMDEIDEMTLPIFDSAQGQTLSAPGVQAQTLMASTHQYANGTFTEVLKRAAEKGWKSYEYCYLETLRTTENPTGWLEPSEVHRKRIEMTDQMWKTEIELQEPSSEGLAINSAAVDAMFRADLGVSDGTAGREEEFEAPAKNGTYGTGADWGKRRDFSATATLREDVRPMRFVALYRDRRKPYHLMVPVLESRLKRYGGRACHDAHGVGDVIDELIDVPADVELEGFTSWQGQARASLFTEYISAIERGDIVCPRSEPWRVAHRYVTTDDLYGSGHPPDEFIAGALAYRATRLKGEPEKPVLPPGRRLTWGGAAV